MFVQMRFGAGTVCRQNAADAQPADRMASVRIRIVIFVVLLIKAALGTAQTVKAEKSLEALKRMSSPQATVLRDGAAARIDSADVVPGDILVLEAGDLIAADGRILENFGMKCDESSMTG